MRIHTDIFKAYDVRGLYPSEINEEVARQIGRGFVAYLGAKRIGVSRDMRISSPGIAAAFIQGAREQGADVVDYGMLATDMLYFGVVKDELEGGAQITASHNPKQYNGAKMVRAGALPLSGDAGLGEIRDMIVNDRLPPLAATPGSVAPRNIVFEYVEKVMSFIDANAIKPFNVVLDAGSGMAGLVAPLLFDQLPCKTTRLCFNIDGNSRTTRRIRSSRRTAGTSLRKLSVRRRTSIAWDGDADRCFFIDGSGEFHRRRLHHRAAGRGISAETPRRDDHLRPAREPRGQGHRRAPRWAALMNASAMRSSSGGCATRMASSRERSPATTTSATSHTPITASSLAPDPRADVEEEPIAPRLAPSVPRAVLHLRRDQHQVASMDEAREARDTRATLPGRADREARWAVGRLPDWHFNVRASNTEPLLRLNLEAATPPQMEKKRDECSASFAGNSTDYRHGLPAKNARARVAHRDTEIGLEFESPLRHAVRVGGSFRLAFGSADRRSASGRLLDPATP